LFVPNHFETKMREPHENFPGNSVFCFTFEDKLNSSPWLWQVLVDHYTFLNYGAAIFPVSTRILFKKCRINDQFMQLLMRNSAP